MHLNLEVNMEIGIGLIVIIAVVGYLLWTYISELNSKIDILLQHSHIEWDSYLCHQMRKHIQSGGLSKAAMLL